MRYFILVDGVCAYSVQLYKMHAYSFRAHNKCTCIVRVVLHDSMWSVHNCMDECIECTVHVSIHAERTLNAIRLYSKLETPSKTCFTDHPVTDRNLHHLISEIKMDAFLRDWDTRLDFILSCTVCRHWLGNSLKVF